MMMNLFVFLTLFCAACKLAIAAPSMNCTDFDEILDDSLSAQHFTNLNENYKNPTNLEEYSKRCKEALDAIKTLRKYNKACQTQLTQQVLSAVLRTRSNYLDKICNEATPEFKPTSEAAICITGKDEVLEGEKKMILKPQVLLDMNVPDEKLRIQKGCCAVLEIKKILLDSTRENCSKHDKIYSDYSDSYLSEAMGLICKSGDQLDCNKMEQLKVEGVEPKTKSFITPIIKIIRTIDH